MFETTVTEADEIDEAIMNLKERVIDVFGDYDGGYKLDCMRLLHLAESANTTIWHRFEAKAIVNLLNELVGRWETDMEAERG
jgi:hypothetical protein